jgi:DNA-binding NarL/FixJ family response regulator
MRSSSVSPESTGPPLRLVIADDHDLLRQGVVSMLEAQGFDVVAQAGDAEDLIRKVRAHRPDVAIVDVRMPPTNTDDGLRAAVAIREAHHDIGVLMLSQYIEANYALELIGTDARGVGYLLKDRVTDIEEFADAVRRVAGGGSVLDPEVVRWMLGRKRQTSVLADLTARELEVLALLAEGCSNQGVARRICVTPRAVEKHVTAILSKLDLPAEPEAHRRVLAVLAYLDDTSAATQARPSGAGMRAGAAT